MHPLFTRIVLLLLFITSVAVANAQKHKPLVKYTSFYYKDVKFIVSAPVLLPQMLEKGYLDTMENFAENWNQSNSPSDELIFALRSLIAIERNEFSISKMPWDFEYLLKDYVKELKNSQQSPESFRYYVQITYTNYRYDATDATIKLFRFLQSWSKELIKKRKLDSTQLYLCNVFAGNIANPKRYLRVNVDDYAEINAFEKSVDTLHEKCFKLKRESTTPVAHLLTGLWLPGGQPYILGNHPEIGMQLGWRDKKNEYDFTWNIRFLSPAPNYYQVIRQDSLFNTNHYDGGYLGFDYTRFVIRKMSFEAGYMAAVAWDYFNAFSHQHYTSQLSPYELSSFDLNAGLHVKWFINRGPTIGIQAKYHVVNYINNGGTNFNGHAFSIDISFGVN